MAIVSTRRGWARPALARCIFLACAGFAPGAVGLIALAAADRLAWGLSAAALGLGLVGCLLAARAAARWWELRSARLDALARALEEKSVLPTSWTGAAGAAHLGASEARLAAGAGKVLRELVLLEAERDELEAVVRSMAEGVVVTDRRGRIRFINRAARLLFALEPERELTGHDLVELCRDPAMQQVLSRATEAAGGGSTTQEVYIQQPVARSLAVACAPVREAAGAPAALVLVFHDVTRLKAYESWQSELVANLTHELRTPLSALRGYAETLARGVPDPATERRFLGIIERQAERLARMVDDLVALSELERGLRPLRFAALDPKSVIEEAAELMSEPARQKGVELRIVCPQNLPPLDADRDRLQQVMINLLDNALKYTPGGGSIQLGAGVASDPDGGGQAGVEFSVGDTGEGIAPADLPRLTERFYRADRARSVEPGGSGLGLAIVKHIVKLHGGRLRIESRLRKGTTVRVWLGLAKAKAADPVAGSPGL